MFYNFANGVLVNVNCDPQPNPDVSGIGIRIALYLQAVFSILTGFGECSAADAILTNISLEVAALSLIQAAYFDSSIDIPHTIIVSHLAIMMSACRSTSNALSRQFLQSREGIKTVSVVSVLDLIFRPFLLAFNLVLWSTIRELQRQSQ